MNPEEDLLYQIFGAHPDLEPVPTDFDPITPTPIALMVVGPEIPKPVCRTMGCPFGMQGCIEQGFCDDDYMLYHQQPHVWLGDYA